MSDNTDFASAEKITRRFLPNDLDVNNWSALEPFFSSLVNRKNNSIEELLQWLYDLSELEAAIEEHAGWLYIRMTCDTQNKEFTEAYTFFVEEINPKIAPYNDLLNKKFINERSFISLDGRY